MRCHLGGGGCGMRCHLGGDGCVMGCHLGGGGSLGFLYSVPFFSKILLRYGHHPNIVELRDVSRR